MIFETTQKPENPRKVRKASRLLSRLLWLAFGSLLASCLFVSDASALSAAGIYREAADSVVVLFGFGKGATGNSGTGTILSREGLILTNHHVIFDDQNGRLFQKLVVYFKPSPISGENSQDLKTAYLVEVVARDPELDLALLRVQNPPRDLRPIQVGDSEGVEVGEPVAAIGHPGGGGLWTLATGTISKKRRDQNRPIFRTDTAMSPGNSGGPLLDENGRLVGINTFVRRLNKRGTPLDGLNYSLRSRAAIAWVNRQIKGRITEIPRERLVARSEKKRHPKAERSQRKRRETSADRSAPKFPGLISSGLTAAPTALVPQKEGNRTQEKGMPPAPQRSAAQARSKRQLPEMSEGDRPEPGFRRFRGPRGETLYGVPNPEVGLRDTLRQARRGYRALIRRTEDSVDEADDRLDHYENF